MDHEETSNVQVDKDSDKDSSMIIRLEKRVCQGNGLVRSSNSKSERIHILLNNLDLLDGCLNTTLSEISSLLNTN